MLDAAQIEAWPDLKTFEPYEAPQWGGNLLVAKTNKAARKRAAQLGMDRSLWTACAIDDEIVTVGPTQFRSILIDGSVSTYWDRLRLPTLLSQLGARLVPGGGIIDLRPRNGVLIH